ncbi:MAG: hypothetical protein ACRC5T_09960 [Cetobacterium sp.]
MAIKTKSDFMNSLVQAGIFPEKGEMLVQSRNGSVYAARHQPERTEDGWKMTYVGEELRLVGHIPVFLGWHCAFITHGEMNIFLNKIEHRKAEKVVSKREAVNQNYHRVAGNLDLFLAKGYINKAKNADDRKLDFNLDFDDWRNIYATKYCPVTGRKLLVGVRKDGVPCPDDLLTVERLNPRLGYVKGNVVAMSYVANNAKSQLDQFVHLTNITDAEKVKLLRKSLYQLEKEMKSRD